MAEPQVGQGTVIEPGCTIGDKVKIGYNCSIKTDVTIGNGVYISHLCVLAQGTVIEDGAFLGPHVTTMNTKHICLGRDERYTVHRTPITIKRGARIGGGVTILPGVVIGEESEIGAGSVVTKDTRPYGRYWGNPATLKGAVPDEECLNPREQNNGG